MGNADVKEALQRLAAAKMAEAMKLLFEAGWPSNQWLAVKFDQQGNLEVLDMSDEGAGTTPKTPLSVNGER